MLKRVSVFLAIVLAAAALLFVLLDTLAGDPARLLLGATANPEAVATLRTELGLDAPGWQRFLGFLAGIVTGDFGASPSLKAPIGALIAERLALTLPLALTAFVVAAAAGLSLGLIAARKGGTAIDRAIVAFSGFGAAVPAFWLGMLLVLAFAIGLKWLPTGGFVPWTQSPGGAIASLLLPCLALVVPAAAALAPVARRIMLAAQSADHIRTAEAKGLTLREAQWRHGLRNALPQLVGPLAGQFAALLLGTVLIENVFYLPGLGRLILNAIAQRDLLLVRGGILALVTLAAAGMLLVSLLRIWADPRLRRSAR